MDAQRAGSADEKEAADWSRESAAFTALFVSRVNGVETAASRGRAANTPRRYTARSSPFSTPSVRNNGRSFFFPRRRVNLAS